MSADDRECKAHWEQVHRKIAAQRRSWFQSCPSASLELIDAAHIEPSAQVIDVGGGTSHLVDYLLRRGFRDVTVLDIAATALEEARVRLGRSAELVTWIETDVTRAAFEQSFDLWHDRATFHFLVNPRGRRAYIERLHSAVVPGGSVIIATFALDGPPTCSQLPVMRHTPTTLQYELGADFELGGTRTEAHVTPSGETQSFLYCWFRRTRRTLLRPVGRESVQSEHEFAHPAP